MSYKNSKQRELIMNYMHGLHGHVKAEEIFESLNKEDKKISLATVYRNLGILEKMHEIKKIALPHDGFVYDKTCEPHYHFYCERCNTLYDIEMPYELELNTRVQDHRVSDHEIVFKGVCKNCTQEEIKHGLKRIKD